MRWRELLAGAGLVVLAAGTLWLLTKGDKAVVIAAVLTLTVTVLALAVQLFGVLRRPTPSLPLDDVADLLAEAVMDQWAAAARERRLLPEPIPVRWQRPSQPFTGPLSVATDSQQFRPLPGVPRIQQKQLQDGGLQDLHAVYGGLGSGRLVIVGASGSGKSSAAVLLVLAALKYRQEQKQQENRRLVPVPVMFTLHGWDSNAQQVQDWLTARLQQTYSQFAGKPGADAADLVRGGRVSVILDGLDEIPSELRPVALQALSQQATFRLVVLARSAEMAAAAKQGFLEGAAALELKDVDPATAAAYLTRVQLDTPPPAWRELTDRLRRAPDTPIARALSSPLTLTLVRDAYRARDDKLREFLGFCDTAARDTEDIENYLLDRVLKTAYAQPAGSSPPRYNFKTAQYALCYIAARMNQERTRDLEWWRIRQWAPRGPRDTATVLVFGLLAGLAGGLAAGLVFGLLAGLVFGLVFGLLAGLLAGLMLGRGGEPAERLGPLQWRQIFSRKSLAAGVSAAFVGGIAATLVTIPHPVGVLKGSLKALMPTVIASAYAPHTRWLLFGIAAVSGLAGGLWAGLAAGFARPGAGKASPLDPRASWRRDISAGLVRGLAVGLTVVAGLAVGGGLVGGLAPGLRLGLAVVAGLGVGLLAGLAGSATWPASLAFVQLAIRLRIPVRLMRFLNDAHERGVLRAVGPVYQFRHARLQDRLARTAPALKKAQELEELLALRLRVLGADHLRTLTARNELAHSRGRAGDAAGAAQLFEKLLADRLRVQGPDHPYTLITRSYLGYWRWQAGDAAGAAKALEELLADRLRMQGPDHPDTLATRANLASVRGQAQNS